MGLLDQISQSISNVGQNAIQMTQGIADITKLNGQIANEEKELEARFAAIGKRYFELHSDQPGGEFAADIRWILESKKRIEMWRRSVDELKGTVSCPSCGTENSRGAVFCTGCGNRLPRPVSTQAMEAMPCGRCGAMIARGQRFCVNCGTPVVQMQQEASQSAQPVMPQSQMMGQPMPQQAVPQPAAPQPAPIQQMSPASDLPVIQPPEADVPANDLPVIQPPEADVPANDLPVIQPPEVDVPVNDQPVRNICPKCGAVITPGDVFCMECGQKLS